MAINQAEASSRKLAKQSLRDLTADWAKWSVAERVAAVLVVMLLIALPLGFLVTLTEP
jgi:hypothetical protein